MSAQWFYENVSDLLGSPSDWFEQLDKAADDPEKLDADGFRILASSLTAFAFMDTGTDLQKLTAITSVLRAYVAHGVDIEDVTVERLSIYLNRLVDDFTEEDSEWDLSSALPGLFELCAKHDDESFTHLRGVSQRLAITSNKLVESYLSFVPFNSRLGSYMDWQKRAEAALASGDRSVSEELHRDLATVMASGPGNWILGEEFTSESTNSGVDSIRHRNFNIWIGLRGAASSLQKGLDNGMGPNRPDSFAAGLPVSSLVDSDYEADDVTPEPGKARTRWLAM